MRRRARGRGAQRGGRGASRTVAIPAESPKMMSFVQISQRPPSYIRDNRGRGKDRSGRSSNGGGILGNLVKAFAMSVAEETIDGNGNAINGNYYLHKKFKKVTETTNVTEEVDGSEVYAKANGVLCDNHPISTSSNSVSAPPLTSDLKRTSQDMPNTLITNFTDSLVNHQKTNGIHNSVNTIKSTSVYKPKFRLAGNGEIEDVAASKSITTPPVVTTVSNPQTLPPPAQPITDRHLDRQSLDQMVHDRISKIIDQNQSVLLSTWPEHLSKRLKSQTQGHSYGRQYSGSQPPTPSPTQRGSAGPMSGPLAMMSGGSTTEITPTINSARTFVFDGRSPLPSPALDLGASPVSLSRKKFSFDNTSMSSCSIHNLTDPTNAQTEIVSGVADLSDSSSTASCSQLPKKRQRLSQPSTIFSGGEVSEMPATNKPHLLPATKTFQDVDLTVRVSNCGPSPSGAKVTIRTNSAGSNVFQAAQVQAIELSHLIERNCPNTSASSCFNSHSNQSPAIEQRIMRLIPAEQNGDFFPLDLNIKTAKPRGRPPRKRKLGNESDSSTTVARPSAAVSPLDLKTKKICKELVGSNRSEPTSTRTNGMLDFIKPTENFNKTDAQKLALSQAEVAEDLSTEKELLPETPGTNPKRPTFLALKPYNSLSKALGDASVLPSPETPRGAKAYNQMYINGHAYTYLGFKISTRSSYTCLFKPQPMFVPQDTDPKLSMYSNWQARPRDSKTDEINISTNDSRVNGRKSPLSTWTLAKGTRAETMTVNSPDGQPPLLFTPTTSDLSIANISPNTSAFSSVNDQVQGSCSNSGSSIPFLQTSNLVKKNLDSHIRKKLSCPSPSDNGNSSSSSEHSVKIPNFPRTIATSNHAFGSEDSSDYSSADESNYSMSKLDYERRRRRRVTDGEGRLIKIHSGSNDAKDGALASSSRSSPDLGKYENPRVKIMEGGFESNEDYTYIRGRGRGRYVCEACGIRCKKPSMLRKHLKTHTDLRPYTCKLCNFSFKTKGNLTKHQKSKSHHKKCIGLGIHPNSSRSLEMTGPIFDSNDEDDSLDEDDDNDMDNGCDSDSNQSNEDDGGVSPATCEVNTDHLEKEIAQSLLDLSHLSRFPRNANNCDNNGASSEIIHKSKSFFPKEFHVVAKHEADESAPLDLKANLEMALVKVCPMQITPNDPAEVPIDLSVRCRKESNAFTKRANGTVKAMGIVGEAQRWEPEEAFLLDGILNLKKVRNTVIHADDSLEEITKYPELICRTSEPEVKIEKIEHVPLLGTMQTEEGTNGFEYEIKKGCRAGSADLMKSFVVNTSNQEAPSAPPVLINSTVPNNRSLVLAGQSQRARLHQPWLSPQGSADESFPDTITSTRERTESMNSCLTVESSNSESTVCRDEIEYVPSPPEGTPSQSVLSEKPNGPTSPNSAKHFVGYIAVKPQAEFRQPSGAQAFIKDEGKAECNICGKTFTRASQLNLHMNIHFLERPFRCDPCGVSFRTKGHLIKHRRSSSHDCKVYLTEAWGVANEENPRPFKCPDCKIAFRIHGHLAKHLRSKMHIMRMECLGKLPFGIYFEMEKSGLNLNEIDTTDCDMSLVSLQNVAKKIYGDTWMERLTLPIEDPD